MNNEIRTPLIDRSNSSGNNKKINMPSLYKDKLELAKNFIESMRKNPNVVYSNLVGKECLEYIKKTKYMDYINMVKEIDSKYPKYWQHRDSLDDSYLRNTNYHYVMAASFKELESLAKDYTEKIWKYNVFPGNGSKGYFAYCMLMGYGFYKIVDRNTLNTINEVVDRNTLDTINEEKKMMEMGGMDAEMRKAYGKSDVRCRFMDSHPDIMKREKGKYHYIHNDGYRDIYDYSTEKFTTKMSDNFSSVSNVSLNELKSLAEKYISECVSGSAPSNDSKGYFAVCMLQSYGESKFIEQCVEKSISYKKPYNDGVWRTEELIKEFIKEHKLNKSQENLLGIRYEHNQGFTSNNFYSMSKLSLKELESFAKEYIEQCVSGSAPSNDSKGYFAVCMLQSYGKEAFVKNCLDNSIKEKASYGVLPCKIELCVRNFIDGHKLDDDQKDELRGRFLFESITEPKPSYSDGCAMKLEFLKSKPGSDSYELIMKKYYEYSIIFYDHEKKFRMFNDRLYTEDRIPYEEINRLYREYRIPYEEYINRLYTEYRIPYEEYINSKFNEYNSGNIVITSQNANVPECNSGYYSDKNFGLSETKLALAKEYIDYAIRGVRLNEGNEKTIAFRAFQKHHPEQIIDYIKDYECCSNVMYTNARTSINRSRFKEQLLLEVDTNNRIAELYDLHEGNIADYIGSPLCAYAFHRDPSSKKGIVVDNPHPSNIYNNLEVSLYSSNYFEKIYLLYSIFEFANGYDFIVDGVDNRVCEAYKEILNKLLNGSANYNVESFREEFLYIEQQLIKCGLINDEYYKGDSREEKIKKLSEEPIQIKLLDKQIEALSSEQSIKQEREKIRLIKVRIEDSEKSMKEKKEYLEKLKKEQKKLKESSTEIELANKNITSMEEEITSLRNLIEDWKKKKEEMEGHLEKLERKQSINFEESQVKKLKEESLESIEKQEKSINDQINKLHEEQFNEQMKRFKRCLQDVRSKICREQETVKGNSLTDLKNNDASITQSIEIKQQGDGTRQQKIQTVVSPINNEQTTTTIGTSEKTSDSKRIQDNEDVFNPFEKVNIGQEATSVTSNKNNPSPVKKSLLKDNLDPFVFDDGEGNKPKGEWKQIAGREKVGKTNKKSQQQQLLQTLIP
ncbi:MAG: hypothetical protein LBC92_04205 [Rickettsiales bacterium]|jgi:hypothetical protein|nr:hypothetical protein [Rickettsiales bacterium]